MDQERGPELTSQVSGTTALLQAVSPVTDSVVWVSGHKGTFGRTADGGESWIIGVVSGADTLQFRDVDAFDDRTAYLMSAGSGPLSRIYRTDDGGNRWSLQFMAEDPGAFLDCMSFWDVDRGLAYGDAVDGVPFILRTVDGGRSWSRVEGEGLPEAQEGEGGFAASGSCVTTAAGGRAWIAAGNALRARVFRTSDYGRSWEVANAPVVGGPGSGLTTLGFVDDTLGYALGGTIGADSVRVPAVALTRDGGVTWSEGGLLSKTGPAYGSAHVPGLPGPVLVAVGPGGIDWSDDFGTRWRTADSVTHWAVAFAPGGAGWAVGPQGRITHLVFPSR